MVVVSFVSKWCIGKKMDICSKCGLVSLLWAPSWSGHNSGGILHIIILVKNVEICSKHLLTVGVVFVSRCYIGVKCWYLLRTSVHNWSGQYGGCIFCEEMLYWYKMLIFVENICSQLEQSSFDTTCPHLYW